MGKAEGKFQDTALVTGASEGIGRAFARLLAEKGHDLVVVARNEARLDELKDELTAKHGISVKVIAKDLTGIEAVDEIWNEIQKESIKITVLINNAGRSMNGNFDKMDIDEQMNVVQLCVNTPTRLMNYCLKEMLKRNHGKIMTVSSIAGFMPATRQAIYGASKAYLLMMSEAIAEEISDSNVTITVLCPGPTETLAFERADADSALIGKAKFLFKKPEDVAQAGYDAMMANKRTVITGTIFKVLVYLIRLFPMPVEAKLQGLSTK